MNSTRPEFFDGVRLKIGCKLNLYLEITGLLNNGYHSLETLFYFLPEPHDLIDIAPRQT